MIPFHTGAAAMTPFPTGAAAPPDRAAAPIPCSACAAPIVSNPAATCPRCLASRLPPSASLPRRSSVVHCPHCRSYLLPPTTWLPAASLLSLLLRRLHPHLSRHRLVHADLIPATPHSNFKLRLVVQTQVDSVILQQSHVVDFSVHHIACNSCINDNTASHYFVQLRQNAPHRRTIYYLEQLIIRHTAAARALLIAEAPCGMDFFFPSRTHAQRFVDFVSKVVPVRYEAPSSQSNIGNYKVEICPVCREDLICLPAKVSHALGNLGPIVICTKVTSRIVLMDPLTLRAEFLDASQYWRSGFKPLLSSRKLVEYIVLDVRVESVEANVAGMKYALATAEVARVSDFGKNDNIFTVRTHIGNILNPGDYAFGYDLYGAHDSDIEIDEYKGLVLPEAVLIKKSYREKHEKRKGKARPWELKRLNIEADIAAKGSIEGGRRDADAEYEDFLRDLEENPESVFDLSLYRNREYRPEKIASNIGYGEDDDSLPLDEFFAKLELRDAEEEDEDESNSMSE